MSIRLPLLFVLIGLLLMTASTAPASAAAHDRIEGTFRFEKGPNDFRPIEHAKVEIYRYGPGCCLFWTWDLVKTTTTDENGYFSAEFPFAAKGVVYGVRVFATNYAAQVFGPENAAFPSPPFYAEPGHPATTINKQISDAGETLNFSYTFDDEKISALYNTAEVIRLGYDYAGARRDPRADDSIGRVSIQPRPPGVIRTGYNPGIDTINLVDIMDVDDLTILHEYAHYLQEQISSFAWIISNHDGCNVNSAHHAWMEGFADYFAQAVALSLSGNEQLYQDPVNSGTLYRDELETPRCDSFPSGATRESLEMFVAAELWDMVDQPTDPYGKNEPHDTLGRRDREIFQIFDHELDTYGKWPTIFDFRVAWDSRIYGAASLRAGPLGSTPAPVSWGLGHVDVFWKGTDNNLWHSWFIADHPSGSRGKWYGPENLDAGPLGSAPVPVSWGPGHIDVFWKGTDNNLWHKWFIADHPSGSRGKWYGPESLGAGPLGSNPVPVSWGTGHVDVFWKGINDDLWHRWFLGTSPRTSHGTWYP